jgi:hypothetical protein|tara:strand:- start:4612 stop:4827 length:216 start_codon:yes stop_codon:yes gene_type:complete
MSWQQEALMLVLDPWLFIAGASVCACMIGYHYGTNKKEDVINDTIMYLIEHKFVRAKKIDGEWEIIPLDEN